LPGSSTEHRPSTTPDQEQRPQKRRRTTDAARFFDTEAVEAGQSEDEDDGDNIQDMIDDSEVATDRQSQAKQKEMLERLHQR
jgi:hypothetical protein